MNLLEIRQKFIELSGRADLATDSSTTTTEKYDVDVGADFFIKAGVDYLDTQANVDKEVAEVQIPLAVGESLVSLKNCRSTSAVSIEDSDGVNTKLEYQKYSWILNNYPKFSSSDSGTPLYYTAYVTRRTPYSVDWLALNETGLAVMPPTDEAITVRVFGKFRSAPLDVNTDSNYWSEEYPHILILAALRALESFYRNTQGVRDMEMALAPFIIGLDKDLAEIEVGEQSVMEG